MTEKTILFVCAENAGRSQMAEAFFKKYSPKKYHSMSAGTQPASQINPVVVQAMKEVGINLEQKETKILSNEMINHASKTVNMGCMDRDSCPALFVKDVIEWQIPDPKGKSIEQVRKIRDQIDSKIQELASSLYRYLWNQTK